MSELQNVTLHGFCDASKKVYSAVVYITGQTLEGNTCGRIVVSKTKVAPLKTLSIPKLELCSCLLLSSLFSCVMQSLNGVVDISKTVCWSDSLDALYWIKNESKQRNVFITNRVNQIRKDTSIDIWRHCPGKNNPADLPSRGFETDIKSINNINKKYSEWIKGPEFIYNTQGEWPNDLSAMPLKSERPENEAMFESSDNVDADLVCFCQQPSDNLVLGL